MYVRALTHYSENIGLTILRRQTSVGMTYDVANMVKYEHHLSVRDTATSKYNVVSVMS